jgi:hypothetical protein
MERPLKLRLSLLVAGAALILLRSVRADLQLIPTRDKYDLDGAQLERLLFPDGPQKVTYTPPRGWQYFGSDDRLTLHPDGIGRAEAEIKVTKLPAPYDLDDPAMGRLTEEIVASAPANARNVAIVSQEKNPLLIERKETFLVIIKYDLDSESYLRSVMFISRKNEQLRFQLTAPQRIFAPLQQAFRASHYSWQNL